MGLRFRKSIRLAPGVRINFSKSGASCTMGSRGASINIGGRGTYLNAGLPGTGLYSRERIGGSSGYDSNVSVSIELTDDGVLHFRDGNGNPLSDRLISVAKKQHGDAIRNLIQQKCDDTNALVELIEDIYLQTPDPNTKPLYQPQNFSEPFPVKPVSKQSGIMGAIFKAVRDNIQKENQEKERQYQRDLAQWQTRKQQFDEKELNRRNMIERDIYVDVEAMEIFLEETLHNIVWPRETIVSSEIFEEGKNVFIDIDLPEIEDMPKRTASVPQRGYKLSVKEMTIAQIQRLYMRHVHGVGFRVVGEVFRALPAMQEVVLSAFSQRANPLTGQIIDEYLYSVQIERNAWTRINFSNLQNLDVVDAFAQFDLKRDMTKSGSFKVIEPFTPNQSTSLS